LNCESIREKRLNSLNIDMYWYKKSHKVVTNKSEVCVEKLID